MRNPLASTIFLATLILLGGCKKDEDPSPPVGGGSSTSTLTTGTVPFVQMTIDGAAVSYTEGSAYGSYTDYSESIATPPASSTAHYTYIIHPMSNPDSPVFGVSLGTFQFQGSSPTDTQFFNFFPTGQVGYGDTETYDGLAMITWWDGSQEWSTFWGDEQMGSSFNIVETLPLPSSGTSSILVRASFTCKLYRDGDENGQFKQVTNGKGVFRIKKS